MAVPKVKGIRLGPQSDTAVQAQTQQQVAELEAAMHQLHLEEAQVVQDLQAGLHRLQVRLHVNLPCMNYW